ncbi:tyrosine-type recombinase/integrase [Bacillus atrophaeus]|uniref:tyrosine-type recombinase/integrase n=1 Tax=Bacillus atrophaeus TaxID=1452 RepID=UPI00228075B1|nr:tyrosine-type recombinase/integrase [Bacillus atrophaeus]MCY8911037.1 tyrosine-type recombinase/integrase [Bacillus atrophaeus]MEC0837888.1 tyrosine-type recombinase/integrase [Bacillus atrophaeus]MEC0847313.1 tyrosine-type recombinase/integrase [Bacillus atrophaeus]MEC0849819.1 tyrosine-type recombinase/integrase [Bacillus atrophaeus]MEC0866326.1 tyrosine-type recombinase/integrase [Bacillus atrophaeus]
MQEYNSKLIEEYIFQLRKAENTKQSYMRDLQLLNKYLSDDELKIDRLSSTIVQLFIDALENGTIKTNKGERYKAASINRIYASIRLFCLYTEQFEAFKDIRITKTQHISELTPKSVEVNYIESIRKRIGDRKNKPKLINYRDLAIIDMLRLTGMRVSELVDLKKSDLTLKGNPYIIHINKSKGKKVRDIPISKERFQYIRRYLDSRNDDSEYVFVSRSNKKLTTRTVQMLLKEYEITPHMLRHTLATELAKRGWDLSTIARFLGNTVAVVQRYTIPTEKQMADAAADIYTIN